MAPGSQRHCYTEKGSYYAGAMTLWSDEGQSDKYKNNGHCKKRDPCIALAAFFESAH